MALLFHCKQLGKKNVSGGGRYYSWTWDSRQPRITILDRRETNKTHSTIATVLCLMVLPRLQCKKENTNTAKQSQWVKQRKIRVLGDWAAGMYIYWKGGSYTENSSRNLNRSPLAGHMERPWKMRNHIKREVMWSLEVHQPTATLRSRPVKEPSWTSLSCPVTIWEQLHERQPTPCVPKRPPSQPRVMKNNESLFQNKI